MTSKGGDTNFDTSALRAALDMRCRNLNPKCGEGCTYLKGTMKLCSNDTVQFKCQDGDQKNIFKHDCSDTKVNKNSFNILVPELNKILEHL